MSDIGIITVAIEAQTDELKKGLAKAEQAVEQASRNMENTTETLAQRAEQSWTEFASKMGVIQQAAAIAQQAMTALSGSINALTDDSLNWQQKWEGVGDAVVGAGIPIVSQFMDIGRQIRTLISDTDELIEALNEQAESLEKTAEAGKRYADAVKGGRELAAALRNQADLAEARNEQDAMAVRHAQQREALEKQIAATFKQTTAHSSERRALEESLVELERIQVAEADKLRQREEAAAAAKEEAHQRQMAQIAEREAREDQAAQKQRLADEERANREQARVLQTTADLQTRLSVLQAEAAGDELGAQMIALQAKFSKMREGATKEQLALIDQIEQAESAKLQQRAAGGPVVPVEAGGPQTASISTALGGLTLAMGGGNAAQTQRKKQTTILQQIAQTSAIVADAVQRGQDTGQVIPAA